MPLKSGGYIVIDQTEAMTTIDVNTGGYVGHRNLEETIFRTNLEAAVTIARQLRLRNLGGIIIIDFIDMQDDGAPRGRCWPRCRRALAGDRAQTPHRQHLAAGPGGDDPQAHAREPGAPAVRSPVRSCEGRGFVRSAETVCHEIFREMLRQSRQFQQSSELVMLAHQDVVERLLDEEAAVLAELEAQVGRPIRLQAETAVRHRPVRRRAGVSCA